MAASLTAQAVLSSIQKWKAADEPKLITELPRNSQMKKELNAAYKVYKKEFNDDKKRIKSIVENIFKSDDLKLNQKWNYQTGGYDGAGGSWNGTWPKTGKLGPRFIEFKGKFEDVKKIVESYEGDKSNDYTVDILSKSNKRGESGLASVEIRVKGDLDINELGEEVPTKEYPIRFTSVGKGIFVGDPSSATEQGVSSTILTDVQEMGSAWIFKNAYARNQAFDSVNSIKTNQKVYDELDNIWKTVSGNPNFTIKGKDGDKWLLSFVGQNRKLLQKIQHGNWSVFTMGTPNFQYKNGLSDWYYKQNKFEKNFMDWIGEKVKIFDISNQNNWNPADVWLIEDEEKVRKEIEFALKNPVKSGDLKEGAIKANLAQMNAIFRDLFTNRKIVGISLKKVESAMATWKVVNVSQKFFKNMELTEFPVKRIECKLGLKSPHLETQDTNIILGSSKASEKFVIQIKGNSTSSFDNLKYEPKDLKNPGARMGKATAGYVDELTTSQVPGAGNWKRDHQKFPRGNVGDTSHGTPLFDQAAQDEYKKIISEIYTRGVAHGITMNMGDVPSVITPKGQQQAIDNLISEFNAKPHIANNKLMQMKWLWYVLGIKNTKDLTQFFTDMIFLAEKAGSQYGPYGKLY